MRIRFFLVAAACALCLLALPRPPVPAPAGPQAIAAQIDFDALHAQAKGALEALRQSHAPRLASAAGTSF